MNITDEMIEAARQAIPKVCGSWWTATRDEMRAALAAALAAQPQPAGPVAEVRLMERGGNAGLATVIHEIDDPLRERLQPGTKLYAAPQPQPAGQWVPHIYAGDCPDERQPDARDPDCPACREMDGQPARVPQPVALPPLPEPYTRQWIAAPHSERLLFTSEQMAAYAYACAAAWGVTVADEGGANG